MRKRKIALVYDAIYPYIKGGAERRFYELGKRLVNDHTEVHLYGMKFWEGPPVIKRHGLILHGIAKARPLYTKSGRRSISQAVLFGLASFKLLFADFDVIDCCGFPYFSLFPAKLAAIIKRKPLYATWHEVWGKDYWREYLGRLGIFGYLVERQAAHLPNQIITNNTAVAERLKTELGVLKPIHIIANGVDTRAFADVLPSHASDVIYVGRLVDFKHIDYLVRAVGELKKKGLTLKAMIVGEGPELPKLKTLADRLNVSKQFTWSGFIEDSNEVYALMKASKVFVLPSSREGFGIVVVEANACGLPVITVNEPANTAQFLIKNKVNGSVVSLGVSAIADSINGWLDVAPQKFEKQVEQYDWSNLALGLTDVYS